MLNQWNLNSQVEYKLWYEGYFCVVINMFESILYLKPTFLGILLGGLIKNRKWDLQDEHMT